MNLPSSLSHFAQIIIDSYFIIDLEHNIVDFNRAFHSMLPRPLARRLKTKKCYEVLQLDICKEGCIARQCWESQRPVRLDEIGGCIVTEDDHRLRFILSAVPIYDDSGEMVGAMEMQRNVTDEALVQTKYQRQMDESAKQQVCLDEQLAFRTKRLLEVSRRLYSVQKELLKSKTDLFG
jgi:PAS domain-containing protein